MPDSETLAERGDAQWELVFVIEGIQTAWCSHRFLEGLDVGDGRVLRRGLEREGMSRRQEIDMRRGTLVGRTMRVRLSDHIGDMAELFSTDRDDWEYLSQTVQASDSPVLQAALFGMHIGTELIGPAGERRQYPVPLGDTLGRQHYAGSLDSQLGAVPSRYSSLPMIWKGRHCALYRVYRDHVTYPDDYSQGWRPASEWDLCWWGSMRDDGKVSGRVWSLECDGERSWTQKDLGLLTQRTPVGVRPTFAYSADEAQGAGWVGEQPGANHGNIAFAPVFTGDSVEELRAEFSVLVDFLADHPGAGGAWSSYSGNVYSTQGGGRSVLFRQDAASAGEGTRAQAWVILHRRMWERMGWDVNQSQDVDADGYSYSFQDTLPIVVTTLTGLPPSDEYIGLHIEVARDALAYEVEPRFPGGVAPLDPTRVAASGQVLNLSPNTAGEVTHNGQTFAPVASDPTDATIGYDLPDAPECDTQGLFLLQGERRFAGQEDAFEESTILQCSWANQQGTLLNNQAVATRMWDPRLVGIPRPMLSSTWAQQENGIQARPLLYLGYQQANGYDLAHLVMQRILLTTGTSTGWSGFAAEAPITSDPGDNDPAILAGFVRLDTERADLGLAIPRDMVQTPIQWQQAAQSASNEALEVFTAIEPGTNSEDVFDGLMRPLGLAWSLAGGRYGVFTPHDPIAESEIEWVITRAEQEGDYGRMAEPDQDLRDYAPVDRFDLKWSAVVYSEGDFRYSAKVDATDAGRQYRPGGIEEPLEAPYHRRRAAASENLRSRQAARASFWARRHYMVRKFPVMPSLGRRMWPGEGVRITHPGLVDAVASEYGVTSRRARIVAVEERFSRDRSQFLVDLLVYAERTTVPRVHGPSARGRGFDSDTDTILVHDDWLGIGGGWSDAATFVEPSYVGLDQFGGALAVKWWQWDGTGLAVTGSGVVESVDTTPGSSTITLSSMTGVYRPCMDTIVVPTDVDEQTAAYALQLFAGIAAENGQDALGPNPRFEDV